MIRQVWRHRQVFSHPRCAPCGWHCAAFACAGSTEFWGPTRSDGHFDPDGVPVLDAAVVDDECFFLRAKQAKALDAAIDVLLGTACRFYGLHNLEINWAKGKTKCMLIYRGPGASLCMQRRSVS